MDFEASLKRAFAEAHEPADDAFVARVSHAVEQKEKVKLGLAWAQVIGFAVGMMAAVTGVFALIQPALPQLMASFGLQLAQAHGWMLSASSTNPTAFISNLSATALTQILLAVAALGGAAAYLRANQQ